MLLNILLGLLITVALAMSGVILLQRSEGGGIVSSGSGQLMTARGAGNLLTKITQVLAAMFFILSLLITVLTGRESSSSAILNQLKSKVGNAAALQKSLTPAPTLPSIPAPTLPSTLPPPTMPGPVTLPPK